MLGLHVPVSMHAVHQCAARPPQRFEQSTNNNPINRIEPRTILVSPSSTSSSEYGSTIPTTISGEASSDITIIIITSIRQRWYDYIDSEWYCSGTATTVFGGSTSTSTVDDDIMGAHHHDDESNDDWYSEYESHVSQQQQQQQP
jgi:hypothetical protein